jgi:hypothetical protein
MTKTKLTQAQQDQIAFWDKYLPTLWTTTKGPPSKFELELTKDYCTMMGLDPTNREFRPVYNQPYITLTGLLKIANRDNVLDGLDSSQAVYEDPDGQGERWIVTCIAHKKGAEHPFVAVADQAEYSSGANLWKTFPRRMTAKCAECLALRMMLNIGIPALEEMDFDERTGQLGHEVAADAKADAQAQSGEAQAQGKKAAKEEKKSQKAEEKNAAATKAQVDYIGYLYTKQLHKTRRGTDGTEALFKQTFDAEHYPHLVNKFEQSLSGSEAKTYIDILHKMAVEHLTQKLGLSAEDVVAARTLVAPRAMGLGEILDEEWPRFLKQLRWTAVDAIYEALGWSDEEQKKHHLESFEGQEERSEIKDETIDAYIATLEKELGKPDAPADSGKTEDGQTSLM